MILTKCVQAKIIGLTNKKRELINREYNEFNRLCQYISKYLENGIEEFVEYSQIKNKFNLYALTKVNAINKIKQIKKKNQFNKIKELPLILHNKSVKLENKNTKLSRYWFKIPIFNEFNKMGRGNKTCVWVAIEIFGKEKNNILDYKLKACQVIKKSNEFLIHIAIQKEIKEMLYSNILAIDLGEKIIATACGSFNNNKPLFLGRKIRGIRRHYSWLRKRLGNKKLLKVIKKIEHKEKNKINTLLHEISRKIVDISFETNSMIFLGDLKGIRDSAKKKGKRIRRIISNMPYLKLTEYIEYKAKEKGIRVIKVKENYTSITCNKCSYCNKRNRKTQGLFKCKECGYQVNADYNACLNILKRSLDYMSKDGALAYALKTIKKCQTPK